MSASLNGRAEVSSLLPLRSLKPRTSEDDSDDDDFNIYADEDYANGFDAINHPRTLRGHSRWARLLQALPALPIPGFLRYQPPPTTRANTSHRRPWKLKILLFVLWVLGLFIAWVAFVAIFMPSYNQVPKHYLELRKRAESSSLPGRVNLNKEQVFIVASLYDEDGSLASGLWGQSINKLIDLLGPDNVFLSLYENDAGQKASEAQAAFKKTLKCENHVVNEHLELDDLTRVLMPDGRKLLKRISFLAKVRNRALMPLEDPNSPASKRKFDKLLYINDIVFDPVDAANLILSTHIDKNGKPQYRAACSMDFFNPFLYYDTFATRDLDGYDMGTPFYPWFPSAGRGLGRQDLYDQKDAVRVRSCWGGMVSFDASYFMKQSAVTSRTDLTVRADTKPATTTEYNYIPARFRSEEELWWDAAECCLIHADIQHASPKNITEDAEIYMNPYIRVAYDTTTFARMGAIQRIERIFSPLQYIINLIIWTPTSNPRREEVPGEKVVNKVWVTTDEESGAGSFRDVERVAKPGGFCGVRKLFALPESGHGGHWWREYPPKGSLRG